MQQVQKGTWTTLSEQQQWTYITDAFYAATSLACYYAALPAPTATSTITSSSSSSSSSNNLSQGELAAVIVVPLLIVLIYCVVIWLNRKVEPVVGTHDKHFA